MNTQSEAWVSTESSADSISKFNLIVTITVPFIESKFKGLKIFAVGILQEWRNINTYKDTANILSLCLPRLPTPKVDFLPMSNLLTYPASILLVQYDDDRLQLLNRYLCKAIPEHSLCSRSVFVHLWLEPRDLKLAILLAVKCLRNRKHVPCFYRVLV